MQVATSGRKSSGPKRGGSKEGANGAASGAGGAGENREGDVMTDGDEDGRANLGIGKNNLGFSNRFTFNRKTFSDTGTQKPRDIFLFPQIMMIQMVLINKIMGMMTMN